MPLTPDVITRYNSTDIIADFRTGNDEVVAKMVADQLEKSYPGYLWGVNVSVRMGVIDLFCFNLDGRRGYTIKLRYLFSWDSLREAVIEAGGQILERYNMPRGRFDPDRWAAIQKDFRGLPVGDVSR